MATDEDILKDARERYAEAESAWSDNINDALDDIRFAKLGEQWPDDVIKQRQDEGRPALTINKMPSFIRQVVNDARLNKPSIKTRPVDSGSDPETAEVINGLFRHIEAISDADVAYDTAIDYAVTGGIGFIRVDVDYLGPDTFDLDVLIKRVNNPASVLWDARSQAADSSDWEYAFISEMISRDEWERLYPDAEVSAFEGDDQHLTTWIGENEIRRAEYFQRSEVEKTIILLTDGQIVDQEIFEKNKELFDALGVTVQRERQVTAHEVTHYLLGGNEVLETTKWSGSRIPIVPVYGDEFSVEGRRYFQSLIHHSKDAQRMFNYWRTASTELVALAPRQPWIGEEGAFDSDPEKWATANSESHAYLEYQGNAPPFRLPFDSAPAGALQEALNASDDMKSITGIYDASLGARSNETSGRAIMVRQREGDISTFHFIDNLTRAIRCVGEVVLELIPKVYSDRQILRIIGEDGSPSVVKLGEAGKADDGSRVFDITAGKYDLVVESGPNFTSKREEAANQMIEFVRSFPPAAPVLGDLLAKNMDWPDADEVQKRLASLLPPQLQQQPDGPSPQEQQMQAQMQEFQMEQQRKDAETQADIRRDDMKAQAEMKRKAISAFYDSQVKLAQAMNQPPPDPPDFTQVQQPAPPQSGVF
jgi:hypothetical protein